MPYCIPKMVKQFDELRNKCESHFLSFVFQENIDGILAVHEFHVWQLTGDRIIASAHIRCHNLSEYMKVNVVTKPFIHDNKMKILFRIGVIHKWRHANMDYFWNPSPHRDDFIAKALVLSSQNPWHPLPLKALTSFMGYSYRWKAQPWLKYACEKLNRRHLD